VARGHRGALGLTTRALVRALGADTRLVRAHDDACGNDDSRGYRGGRAELRIFAAALASLSVDKRTAFVLVEIEGPPPKRSRARSVSLQPQCERAYFYARAALREAMEGIRP